MAQLVERRTQLHIPCTTKREFHQGQRKSVMSFFRVKHVLLTRYLSICKIFADDTKLYNTIQNHMTAQEDLNVLRVWSDTWNLYFNASKCKVLHIGKNNPRLDYVMNAGQAVSSLEKCSQEKDLGVTCNQ